MIDPGEMKSTVLVPRICKCIRFAAMVKHPFPFCDTEPINIFLDMVSVKDPPDVLNRQKCLDALAALRHSKWFQV